MADCWVISDTHFNHSNILHFVDAAGVLIRPQFDDAHQMNEYMIERWNATVHPGDKVYHLGDVVMGSNQEQWMKQHWPRLAGRKVLIVGNHDDIKMHAKGGWWSAIYESRDLRELGLLLTHRPAHASQLWDYRRDRPMRNIHGHIHQQPAPSTDHINVSVECIMYTPVHIDTLKLY
jgi:calcineurin-like phosphoesterase family protein